MMSDAGHLSILTESNLLQDSANLSTLRKTLDIRSATIVFENIKTVSLNPPLEADKKDIEMEENILNQRGLDAILPPGSVIIIVDTERKKKFGLQAMKTLCGYKKKLTVTGKVTALVENHSMIDLLNNNCKMIYMDQYTSMYRKLTPKECMHFYLSMYCALSYEEREALIESMELRNAALLSSTIHVGDAQIDEGAHSKMKDRCCQLRSAMSSLDRWKLNFLCNFFQPHRMDFAFLRLPVKELSDISLESLFKFIKASGSSVVAHATDRVDPGVLGEASWLCVKHGSRTLFSGKPDEVVNVFSRLEIPVPTHHTACSFLFNLARTADLPKDIFVPEEVLKLLGDPSQDVREIDHPDSKRKIDWFIQFRLILVRDLKNYLRTPGLTTLRVLLYLVMLVICSIFAIGTHPGDISWKIYVMVAFFDFTVAISLFGLFALRVMRKTLFAEVRSPQISFSAWHFGNFIASGIVQIFLAIIPSIIMYVILELSASRDQDMTKFWSGFKLFLNYFVFLWTLEELWTMIALCIPDKKKSTIIASFFALAFLVGQGIFTKLANKPASRFVMFISIFRPLMNSFFDSIVSF